MSKIMLNCPNLLNNFNLLKSVGSGGMGDVFLANDKRLERNVAIKVLNLPYDQSKENTELITRFRTEAKAIAKLQHPNILSIFDIGEENGYYYMIMEYIEGTNLENFIKTNIIPEVKFINAIILQVCNALEYAHSNNIVHRDIKPANIILMPNNMVKLADFGIAQLNNPKVSNGKVIDATKITENGSILGSIAYISPEQLIDAATVEHPSDIYSLGVTIYELVTGQLPFSANSPATLITKIMTEKPVPLHKINSNIPESFSNIISKAMEKNPTDRFKTISEMKLELSNLVDRGTFFNLALPSIQEDKTKFVTTDLNKSTRNINKNYLNTISSGLINTKEKILDLLKINNYLWVHFIINNINTIETNLTINNLKTKIKEPDINGNYFSGVVVINDDIFLFVYEGCFIGALNSRKSLKGQSVFDSLPIFDTKITLKPLNDKKKCLPIILSNILNLNGEKIQENLDSSMIDLVPMINELTAEKERFTGYIVCRKTFDFSLNKVKVLLVGKNESLYKIKEVLSIQNSMYEFKCCINIANLEQELQIQNYDIIVSDFEMEDRIIVEFFNGHKEKLYLFSDNLVDDNLKFTINSQEIKIYNLNKSLKILELSKNIETYVEEKILKDKAIPKLDSSESYIFAFSESERVFSLLIGDNTIPKVIDNSIEDIFNLGYFIVSIYKSNLTILPENLYNLLPSIEAVVNFKDSEVNFSAIESFKDREIPCFISDAFKDNIKMDFKCNQSLKINYLNQNIDILKDFENTSFNKISNWVTKELIFSINNSNTIPIFKNLYSRLPKQKYFKYCQLIKGEDKNNFFDVVVYDESQNPIMLINLEKNSSDDFDLFLEKCLDVQKNLYRTKKVGLDAVVFISKNITKSLISNCLSKTKNRGFFSKEKNIFKTNSGDGFQVLIVKENNTIEEPFSIISPEIA